MTFPDPVTLIDCPAGCDHGAPGGGHCEDHGERRKWTGSPGVSLPIPYCDCPPTEAK